MKEGYLVGGGGGRGSMLMALAIYGIARGSEASAADTAPKFELPRPQFSAPILAHPLFSPSFAATPAPVEPEAFWPSEFRPRKRGLFTSDAGRRGPRLGGFPRRQPNSMAAQLGEFKPPEQFRLVARGQSQGGSLPIQAGKH